MRRITALVIIIVFLSGGLYPVEAQEVKRPKSGRTAVYWSLGATLIPCVPVMIWGGTGMSGLIGVSLLIGPSAGHFYAHQWGRGLKTAGLRLGIGVVGVFGASFVGLIGAESFDTEDINWEAFWVVAGIAGGCIVGSAVYDIATAPASVRKYNESIGIMGRLNFVPRLNMKNKSYGLSVVYRF